MLFTTFTRMSSRWRAAALLAPALVIAGAAALGNASGQAAVSRTLTLKELDKGSTFVHVRNTRGASRRSNHQGDLLAFTNPIADASGARIGKLHAHCVTTVGARNFMRSTLSCTAIVALPDGDLTGQFLLRLSERATEGAVTGGTGAYTGARGAIVSEPSKGGSTDTITLID